MPRGDDFYKDCCKCATCHKFQSGGDWWFGGTRGVCGMCGRDDLTVVPFIPSVVKEFMQVKELCNGCRNSICCVVQKRFGLCFASNSDDEIKMALCARIRLELSSMVFMAERPEFFTHPKYARCAEYKEYRQKKLDAARLDV